MRKLIAVIIVFLTVSLGTALGQEGKANGQKIEKLKMELNLSDEQTQELRLIFKEARKEIRDIKENEAISKEDKRSLIISAKDDSESKIQLVLTQEQMAKFNEVKANRKKELRAKRQEKKEAVLDELGVSEEQKLEIRKIKDETKTNIKRIKSDSGLTEEEKKAQIKLHRNKAETKVQKVLTEEQYKALELKKREMRQKKKSQTATK